MAEEEQSQERTEEPSAKRLKESREKGQVARSKDFNALMILLVTGGILYFIGAKMARGFVDLMTEGLSFTSKDLVSPWMMFTALTHVCWVGIKLIIPLMACIFLISLIAPIGIGGWVFSTEALMPKFSRLNPAQGLKRMFSLKSLVELGKSFLKFILVFLVAMLVIKHEFPEMFYLAHAPVEVAITRGLLLLLDCFLLVSASLILIAVIDVPYQLYEHMQRLKMTKQELKEEYKETEGKPEVKSQIRRAQQELARRRMMTDVPKATVVLTNPTHYAVAVVYDQKGNKPPLVVAKGKDLIAMQINKIAKAHTIPIISIPPLARALYFSTEINAEIPRGLYVAVAQVLAYVFQLNDKRHYDNKPDKLQDVPIPQDLRRDSEETTV